MGKRARQLVVTLHVLSSVAWTTLAVVLLALLLAVLGAPREETGETARYAAWAAEFVDAHVLVFAANTSAFTGLLLAAATPWGFLRHRWVAIKLVLTAGQIYVGIVVLSGALRRIAAAEGGDGPVLALAVGAGLMAGALAFQVWLSITKPGGKLRGGRGGTAPAWVFGLGVLAPVLDVALGTALGRPLPALSLVTLLVLAVREVAGRATAASRAQPDAPAPVAAARAR